jgi:hypothetical protein
VNGYAFAHDYPASRQDLQHPREYGRVRIQIAKSISANYGYALSVVMLGATDHETSSYLEIDDTIQRYGASPTEDLPQLWRKIVFSVLISNTGEYFHFGRRAYELIHSNSDPSLFMG